MLKISYAGCFGLSPAVSAQFALKMSVAAQNRKNFLLEPPILRVQGHSRSSMVTFLKKLLPVLVMISNMFVPIWNHFHVRRANNGRITLLRQVLLFFLSFVETPFTQWHEILSQNTRDSKLSCGENQKSLSHLGSDRYRVVTDTKPDTKTPGQNYHSQYALLALARKKVSVCRVEHVPRKKHLHFTCRTK